MIPFIDLAAQQKRIRPQLEERLKKILDHGQYILGPEVTELEERLANFTRSKHVIACSNGTDALLACLLALDIGPGDEVIVPDFSFFATAEMVSLIGASPVFVDINPRTFNLDPLKMEKVITDRTKAIIPVSLYGQCPDMDLINELALKAGVAVIEDAAQSFGATYKGKKSCNLSELATTSFFPAKPLGAYGDAGACFTNDDKLAEKLRMVCNHGQSERYLHQIIGINGRLDSMQAAVLLEKLTIFDEEVKLRQSVANRYNEALSGLCEIPFIEESGTSVYAQYTILTENRDELIKKLSGQGVPTSVHYPMAMSDQPVYSNFEADTPISKSCAQKVLSLPMHPYLEEKDQDTIIKVLKSSL